MFGTNDQAFHTHGAAENGLEFLAVIWLGQVGEGALHERSDGVLLAGMTGQDDNRQIGVQFHHDLHDRETVEIRQLNIQEGGAVPFAFHPV